MKPVAVARLMVAGLLAALLSAPAVAQSERNGRLLVPAAPAPAAVAVMPPPSAVLPPPADAVTVTDDPLPAAAVPVPPAPPAAEIAGPTVLPGAAATALSPAGAVPAGAPTAAKASAPRVAVPAPRALPSPAPSLTPPAAPSLTPPADAAAPVATAAPARSRAVAPAPSRVRTPLPAVRTVATAAAAVEPTAAMEPSAAAASPSESLPAIEADTSAAAAAEHRLADEAVADDAVAAEAAGAAVEAVADAVGDAGAPSAATVEPPLAAEASVADEMIREATAMRAAAEQEHAELTVRQALPRPAPRAVAAVEAVVAALPPEEPSLATEATGHSAEATGHAADAAGHAAPAEATVEELAQQAEQEAADSAAENTAVATEGTAVATETVAKPHQAAAAPDGHDAPPSPAPTPATHDTPATPVEPAEPTDAATAHTPPADGLPEAAVATAPAAHGEATEAHAAAGTDAAPHAAAPGTDDAPHAPEAATDAAHAPEAADDVAPHGDAVAPATDAAQHGDAVAAAAATVVAEAAASTEDRDGRPGGIRWIEGAGLPPPAADAPPAEPGHAPATDAAAHAPAGPDGAAAGAGHDAPAAAPRVRRRPTTAPIAAPYELVRTLQAMQDDMAAGSTAALAAQRALLQRMEEEFAGADPLVWQDRRNARALVTYTLGGGRPGTLRRLLGSETPPDGDAALMRGALAYVEGDEATARKYLTDIDAKALPASLGGQLALAQAALVVGEDPKRSLELLDTARLLAPGTLVEEAALRRQIFVASELNDLTRFEALSGQYLRRFRRSVYAGNFRRRFAAALSRMQFLDDPAQFHRLDDMLAETDAEARRELYLVVAQAAVNEGKTTLAATAAERALASAPPGSVDEARGRLYRGAALAVTSDGLDAAMTELGKVNRRGLPRTDAALLQAASETAMLIQTAAATASAAPAPLAENAEEEKPSETVTRARDAIAAIDTLLEQAQ